MHASASSSPIWISYAALGISGIALLVAGASLWRSQLAPMRLIVVSGPLTLRVTRFISEAEHWFVPDAVADFTFTNAGAQSGIVRNVRLRVDYPELSIPDAHEYFKLTAEVDAREYDKHANNYDKKGNRDWLQHAAISPGASFVLLGRESQTKRLVFSSRWDKPIDQRTVILTLEVYTEPSKKWQDYESWKHRLRESDWQALVGRKMGLSQYPDSWPRADSRTSFPADLHDHTGVPNKDKESLPAESDNRDYGYI